MKERESPDKTILKNHPVYKILKKEQPKAVAKVKKSFAFRYYKSILLIACIIIAYIIFSNPKIQIGVSSLGNFGYIGLFVAGIFLVLGFSAPFAAGFLIISRPENIFIAALIVSIGAIFSDTILFISIKQGFEKEIKKIEKNKTIEKIKKIIINDFGTRISHYLLYIFAGIIIASPLPDEVGVAMLAGLTHIKLKALIIIGFILHYLVILSIFYFIS